MNSNNQLLSIEFEKILNKISSPDFRSQLEDFKNDEFSTQSIISEMIRVYEVISSDIDVMVSIPNYNDESIQDLINGNTTPIIPQNVASFIRDVQFKFPGIYKLNVTTMMLKVREVLNKIAKELDPIYWILFGSPEVLLFIYLYSTDSLGGDSVKKVFANLTVSAVDREYHNEYLFMYLCYRMSEMLRTGMSGSISIALRNAIPNIEGATSKLWGRNNCAFCWMECYKQLSKVGKIFYNFLYSLSQSSDKMLAFALVNVFNTYANVRYHWSKKIVLSKDLRPYDLRIGDVDVVGMYENDDEVDSCCVYNPTDEIEHEFVAIVRFEQKFYIFNPNFRYNDEDEFKLFNTLDDVKAYLTHSRKEVKKFVKNKVCVEKVSPFVKWGTTVMVMLILIAVVVVCYVSLNRKERKKGIKIAVMSRPTE